jgi:hypothetical protein
MLQVEVDLGSYQSQGFLYIIVLSDWNAAISIHNCLWCEKIRSNFGAILRVHSRLKHATISTEE